MADTASNILQSASRLFATEGYGAASLSAVAEAAGTSKQVLLHHYGSKERLYLSVLREVGVKLAATVAKAQVEATGPASQLEQVLMSLLSPQNDELVRLTLRALLAIQSSDAQAVHWPLQPFLESLRALALAASKKESVPDDERGFAAVYGLLGGVSYLLISRNALTGMYGERRADQIEQGFRQDIRARIAGL